MPGTKTLAYYGNVYKMDIKRLIILGLRPNVIKKFTVIIYERHNKLECFFATEDEVN